MLQGELQNILTAYSEIEIVKEQLADARTNAEETFRNIFALMTDRHGEDTFAVPRTCRRQIHRSNVPGTVPEEYWRVSIFVPFLDHIISEFDSRFSALSMQSVKGFQLLPNFATDINIEDAEKTLAELYMEDLPSPETFRAELDRWQRR